MTTLWYSIEASIPVAGESDVIVNYFFSVEGNLITGFYNNVGKYIMISDPLPSPYNYQSSNIFDFSTMTFHDSGINFKDIALKTLLNNNGSHFFIFYGLNSVNTLYNFGLDLDTTTNYINIQQIQGPPVPISNACFPAGTLITTNQGSIPIEKINPDIHTIRNKKIIGITSTVSLDKHLVCFEKDALAPNVPSEKTVMSNNHSIFYKGKMIPAKFFAGKFENVKKVKYNKEILYNVLMENHDNMMVNNLICETLHPENCIARLYKALQSLNPKEQEKLIKEHNKYYIKNNNCSTKK